MNLTPYQINKLPPELQRLLAAARLLKLVCDLAVDEADKDDYGFYLKTLDSVLKPNCPAFSC